MSQLFLLKHGLQRMRFHTSPMLREVAAGGGGGGALGKPMGAKKGKGLAKTNWDRASAPTTAKRAVAPKRDWKKPVDQHAEKHAGESYKTHERHVNKFAPPPTKKTETIAQKRERKKKEEELHLLAKEEEKERHLMAVRKAKLKAKDLAESNHMKDVFIPEIINVANLSRVLGVRIEQVIRTMDELDMGNTKHDRMLNADESSLIAMQLDMNPIVDSRQSLDLFPRSPCQDPSQLHDRPPIVTIMGHVDHGKTTLLDTLRKTSVAAGEAGGITQHIGAFSVKLPSNKMITFLDTPGHAAFSSMRQRGAQVTDIVVLVVAADDGVMPQTQEAIKHAHAANVPIVVAINKCDKPGVDASRVKQELARYNVHLEEIGGDVPCVEVSGLTGKNLDQLEETIVTLSEILELKAERGNHAEGVVIESQIEKGRGNVATILVQRGTLKAGSVVVAGQTWCKVRSMTDYQGKPVKEAPPGTPVKVIGWKDVPSAGDEMLTATDENLAKTVVDNRVARHQREQQLRDLEVINDKRRHQREQLEQERMAEKAYKKEMYMYQKGLSEVLPDSLGKRLSAIQTNLKQETGEDDKQEMLELRAVVKGDVSGTVEAVVDCLAGLQNKQIRVKVVHSSVGNISEGDVQLASACEGQVIGFNVKADKRIMAEASKIGVQVKSYSIIYKLLEEVKDTLSDMLPPIVTTQVVGEAALLQVFDINTKGRETRPVAGCRVTNGSISKNGRVRIVRNKETVWEGEISDLRQVKKEITEAKKGLECGMSFEGFTDFKAGDIIQSVQTIETKQKL
ncbi:translation initiation factor IF-2 [Mucor mucedo]|uniref:translation initiation factor IF-2 n=1 Tax=Mucor mucedo TaxID=29922 RepID=UPI00221F45B3|nr:translation initiation factor IF-2 [Mucor mucedo]KAI7888663.1 translation initiation factor IF-2 [Mucor mucedo]